MTSTGPMDSSRQDIIPPPSRRDIVLGVIAWGWIAFAAVVYFTAHPLRLKLWGGSVITGPGAWSFPAHQAWGVVVAALTVMVAWGFGRTLGARMGLWRGDPGEHAIATLGGLAALAMGVFLLGVAGLLYPWAFWTLLGAAAVGAWAIAPDRPRCATFIPAASFRPMPPAGFAWIPVALGLLALVVSFVAALAPAMQSDGIRYHLFGPQEYLRAHRIHYIPHSAFTNFPFLVEMLFTLGLGMGNDVGAKLLHWVHLPLAALLVAALTRAMTGARPARRDFAPRLAAALFLTTPVAAIVAGWSFIDLAITAYFLALLWSLSRWATKGANRADLLAAGFFAGAAVGTKYTMIVPAALAGAVVVFQAAPALRDRFRRAALFVLAASLCSVPWIVKNVVLTGNPVYPLAYGVFDGGDWSPEAARFYAEKAKEKGTQRGGVMDFVAAPFDTAFYWVQFESQNPGVGYLMAFPLVAGWVVYRYRRQRKRQTGAAEEDSDIVEKNERVRRGTVCLVAAFLLITAVVFFAGYKSNRFLLPIWALAASLAGAVIAGPASRGSVYCADHGNAGEPRSTHFSPWSLLRPRAAITAGLLLASAYGLYWTTRYLAAEQSPPPFPAALGFEDRDDYLSAALSYYPAVQWLTIHAEPGEKVFYIGEYHGYPSAVPVAVSDWFDVPWILALLRETPDNDALLDRLRSDGYRFLLVSFAELSAYGPRYLRPRFSDEEWHRFEELLHSPWLQARFELKGVAVFSIQYP